MASDVRALNFTRRSAVLAIACTACAAARCEGVRTVPTCVSFEADPGRMLAADAARFPGAKPLDLLEDFENPLVIVLAQIKELLQIDFAFGLFDDPSDVPNAGAIGSALLETPDGRAPRDGTILVGRRLIEQIRLKSPESFGACLTAVCAHEAGHIVQSKYADVREALYASSTRILDTELHADFMCGFVAASRKRARREYPAVMQAMTQFRFGDKGRAIFPHGTDRQRGDAVYAGFLLGERNPTSPHDVAIEGLRHVKAVHR